MTNKIILTLDPGGFSVSSNLVKDAIDLLNDFTIPRP
jgi:hypothetical protein